VPKARARWPFVFLIISAVVTVTACHRQDTRLGLLLTFSRFGAKAHAPTPLTNSWLRPQK
jgi:hypothetical protein